MKTLIFAVAALGLLAACSPKTGAGTGANSVSGTTAVVATGAEVSPLAPQPAAMVLKATAFKMSGDYANNVAVSVGSDGQLTYFPAPTDITPASVPVEIGDGWWLNRQGLGAGSVFTKWTFEEYHALRTAPTPAEIKAAIIPGAVVTDFVKLPVSATEAAVMPAADLKKYLP